ncbi:MAG: hypothetical protein KY475_06815 [Planctomycetes bacterium]|nr:hypothetical protein [Planctomycetota bacterium]
MFPQQKTQANGGKEPRGLVQPRGNASGEEKTGGIPPAIGKLLGGECLQRYVEQFAQEYQPFGPTELAIVRDMARQAAAMELWGEAVGAVERQAVRGVSELLIQSTLDDEELRDAVLAGAVSAEATDRSERHGLGHSRAFYRALAKLEEVQSKRRKRGEAARASGTAMPPRFRSEAACEQYLEERLRTGNVACRRCGAAEGYYCAARRAWECARCKAQVGLRHGTVMARSPIPLLTWFDAIRWLLWRPTSGAVELAERLGVSRVATVRALAGKIREAMGAENASKLLAGLDVHYARGEHLNLSQAHEDE